MKTKLQIVFYFTLTMFFCVLFGLYLGSAGAIPLIHWIITISFLIFFWVITLYGILDLFDRQKNMERYNWGRSAQDVHDLVAGLEKNYKPLDDLIHSHSDEENNEKDN